MVSVEDGDIGLPTAPAKFILPLECYKGISVVPVYLA